MAKQYAEFSYALPVKMYPINGNNTIHLDDNWQKNRLLSFQTKVTYAKRWEVGDSTPMQLTSTIPPDDYQIWDCHGTVLGSIPWIEKLSGAGFKVYELNLTLDPSWNNKVLYLYQNVELMDTKYEFLSEALHMKTTWPQTRVIEYSNRKNNFNIWFITGVKFKFRIETAPMDYDPSSESTDFVDELHDTTLLSAMPYDVFTMYIGGKEGIGDWAQKIMNYIIHCDNWKIEGKRYAKVSGEKWDVAREKNYPLVWISIAITPAENIHSAQLNSETIEPGLVAGWVMDTNFFGESVEEIIVEEFKVTE